MQVPGYRAPTKSGFVHAENPPITFQESIARSVNRQRICPYSKSGATSLQHSLCCLGDCFQISRGQPVGRILEAGECHARQPGKLTRRIRLDDPSAFGLSPSWRRLDPRRGSLLAQCMMLTKLKLWASEPCLESENGLSAFGLGAKRIHGLGTRLVLRAFHRPDWLARFFWRLELQFARTLSMGEARIRRLIFRLADKEISCKHGKYREGTSLLRDLLLVPVIRPRARCWGESRLSPG